MIGDTQSEASTALQAAGFALGRVSQVVDITCEYIGEVKTQSPAAGTLARLGTVGQRGDRQARRQVPVSRVQVALLAPFIRHNGSFLALPPS